MYLVYPRYIPVHTKYELCMHFYVLVHALYALQSNQFVPVFQGMLVQEKFRWCKLLLLLLSVPCHVWQKTASIVCHCLTCLDSWQWQAPKKSVQVLEATVFLCLHAIHKPADSANHCADPDIPSTKARTRNL